MGVLPFIRDEENPADLVKTLTRPLASGSYLTISHFRDHPEHSLIYAGVGHKP